jgi:two-component system, NarL family, invasion response regulator UvrY
MIDIIVCDDHPVVREGLIRIVTASLEIGSVREADSAQTLLDRVREKPSDLVLLDISLPGRGGLDALQQLRREYPRVPVLVLSVHPADQYAVRALRAGAAGYLTKNLASAELVNAVRTVVAGRTYLTLEVAERLAEDLKRPDHRAPHEALSDREFEILGLLAEGKSVKEIARQLCLSYSTISTYRSRLLTKLNLKSDAEIVRYGLRHHLIEQ